MTLKQEDTMFAVVLTTIDGDKFFATIGDTTALYHWKRDAVKFKKELIAGGCKSPKVVRVTRTITA